MKHTEELIPYRSPLLHSVRSFRQVTNSFLLDESGNNLPVFIMRLSFYNAFKSLMLKIRK